MSKKKNKAALSPGKFSPTIANKKARYNYHLREKLEAGIALWGTEVKSLRQGKASLEEAYCRIRAGELYLVGCTIAAYEHGNRANHEPTRLRKLLVHKRELLKMETKLTQKGLTLIPVRIYFKRGLAKVEIALAQGKTHQDKRDKLRDRQAQREIRQALNRRK
ncbi:MAG: hypothetical protein AMJ79_14115 [Phycisphaerae bacterium SM23_30]|nr:MAG: hypothetical protein AMJ79_14115 [Phycisphaerae bacterium SM23_30]